MMRWWILAIFFICPLFTMPLFPLTPAQQEPSASDWLTLLHLTDCELPCWIDIVPGETTVGEAVAQVAATYADTSLYQVEESIYFWPTVVFKTNGAKLKIVFISDNGQMTESSIVRGLSLAPFIDVGTSTITPRLSDLQDILGDPVSVRLVSGIDKPSIMLIYRDGLVYSGVEDLECDKVLSNQRIGGVTLYGEVPTNIEWLSDPQEWHGFNYCYNFERKLS